MRELAFFDANIPFYADDSAAPISRNRSMVNSLQAMQEYCLSCKKMGAERRTGAMPGADSRAGVVRFDPEDAASVVAVPIVNPFHS
jgi:hypothetical protein